MATSPHNVSSSPPSPPAAATTVEVWTVALDVPSKISAAAHAILTPAEQHRAGQFRVAPARRNYVVAHAALRRIVADRLSRAPGEVNFQNGPHGKPALAGGSGASLEFNLSHSGDFALVATSRTAPVGVDVERIRALPDALAIARRFFTSAEAAVLSDLSGPEQAAAFFSLWTCKEAVVKATGQGIAHALSRFEFAGGNPPALRSVDGKAEAAKSWSLHSFQPAAGYVAAVAVEAPKAQFILREFSWAA
jgi:4'-phosphopantetheinyl transferase